MPAGSDHVRRALSGLSQHLGGVERLKGGICVSVRRRRLVAEASPSTAGVVLDYNISKDERGNKERNNGKKCCCIARQGST